MIFQAIFEFIVFFVAIFTCFYLPGKFLVSKLKLELTPLENLFFSVGLGILSFTLLSYILSYLNLEILILPVVLLIDYFSLKQKDWLPKKIDKIHILPLCLVFVLTLAFSINMLITGQFGNTIIYRYDDLWNLSLINELRAHFPPDNPGIASVPLKGYHFFYNLLLAKIGNAFSISSLSLHSHFFPLLISFLWGLGVYVLMHRWSKKISVSLWAVFLTMFGGSFAYILRFQGHPGFNLNSSLGIEQPLGIIDSPSFSLSIVIVLLVLFSLHRYLETKQNKWLFPLVLCLGLVTMFKVYAGIILFGGFSFFTLTELIKKRFTILIACFFIAILFFLTYWVFSSSGYLIFDPLWAPHRILQTFPWYGFDEKIYTYSRLHVIRGLIETELTGLGVFIFGNLGTRLLGILLLLLFITKKIKISLFTLIVLAMTLISFFIPLLFIQSGKVFEIIQTAWYFLFLTSLFAAFGFARFFELKINKILKILIFTLIIIATLPSAYDEYVGDYQLLAYYPHPKNLSDPYFQTINFLSKQGNYDSTVLEMPSKDTYFDLKAVTFWYRYHSTPAIVALANRRTFLNYQLSEFPGVNTKPRLELLVDLVTLANTPTAKPEYTELNKKVENGLKQNDIKYLYSPWDAVPFNSTKGFNKIYQNGTYTVYEVGK